MRVKSLTQGLAQNRLSWAALPTITTALITCEARAGKKNHSFYREDNQGSCSTGKIQEEISPTTSSVRMSLICSSLPPLLQKTTKISKPFFATIGSELEWLLPAVTSRRRELFLSTCKRRLGGGDTSRKLSETVTLWANVPSDSMGPRELGLCCFPGGLIRACCLAEDDTCVYFPWWSLIES